MCIQQLPLTDPISGNRALVVAFKTEHIRIPLFEVFLAHPTMDPGPPGSETARSEVSPHQLDHFGF